ncbi:MAG: hypothetical protein FJ398_18360 [Verrucomicrobia bacterium]|nr:hypothetical protein [Verrucomicrobiota bacterium]
MYSTLSRDGRFVAVGKGVWDWQEMRLVLELPPQDLARRLRSAFSPDGTWFVKSTSSDYTFHEVGTWREGRRLLRNVPSPTTFGRVVEGTPAALPSSRAEVAEFHRKH